MTSDGTQDAWATLRQVTTARLALGRSGAALPTREILSLALAHARARDAVHIAMDTSAVEAGCHALGMHTVFVRSVSRDRTEYLRRPDLGRRLSPPDADLLKKQRSGYDLVVVIADGLSGQSVAVHAPRLLSLLKLRLDAARLTLGPIVIAQQARVALGDEVGAILRARIVLVLIGERPGLSSCDSLGAYLTCRPQIGRADAERNCISNIRAKGLDYESAADRLMWLISEGLRIGATGVGLKDESSLLPVLPQVAPDASVDADRAPFAD